MTELIEQYKRTRKALKLALERALDIDEEYRTPADDADIVNLRGMIQNMDFSIRYMEQSHYPDPLHSISRWATTKREILLEPDKLNRMFGDTVIIPCFADEEDDTTDSWNTINEYLDLLSPREKECFLLIYEQRYAWREAADLIGIAHGRINNIMYRVRKKFLTYRDSKKPQDQ